MGRTSTSTTSRAVAALLVLVAAACGGDDGDEAASATSATAPATSSTTTTSTPTASSTTTSTTGDAERWVRCENPKDGYALEHPPDWETNAGDVVPPCSLFDPEPFEVPQGTEVPLDLAVSVYVDPVDLDDVELGRSAEVRTRQEATIDGRDAVRLEAESTGEALRPAGTVSVRWFVDLDGRTLVASANDVGQPAFARKVEVLDRMVRSLTFGVGAGGDGGTGGSAPVGPPGAGDVRTPGFPSVGGETALLTDVRTGAHAGFDRVVLEFRGDARPGYRVGYVDAPVRQDGSGHVVEVAGTSQLEIRVTPASGVDLRTPDAEQVYEGPVRLSPDGTEVVRELVRTGDYEAQLAWVVGVDEPVPFAVTLLDDPVRLVVDLVHDPAAAR